jgi:hypothetical protein
MSRSDLINPPFITIESAVEWIRHLATECPECEGEAW